jgi:hypothetical protein
MNFDRESRLEVLGTEFIKKNSIRLQIVFQKIPVGLELVKHL